MYVKYPRTPHLPWSPGATSDDVWAGGPWNASAIQSIAVDEKTCEGYVVRLADEFTFADFGASVAKWVRPNHVQSNSHWMHQAVVPNGLADRRSLLPAFGLGLPFQEVLHVVDDQG